MWFGDLVDHDLVGGHLAAGVVRRLHGLPGRRGGGRVRRRLRRLHDSAASRGVRRRRAPLDPPGRPASPRTCPTSTRRPTTSTRSPTPRATRRPPARHLARRRGLPGRRQRLPDPPPLRQRHPRRLRRRARRAPPTATSAAGSRPGCAPPASTPSGSTRDGDGPVLRREGSRPHRVRGHGVRRRRWSRPGPRLVDLADEPVRLPARRPVVVPNAGGETFARLRSTRHPGRRCAATWPRSPTTSTRAVLWATAIDLVRCGDLAPEDFLGLVDRTCPRERAVGDRRGRARLGAPHPGRPPPVAPTPSPDAVGPGGGGLRDRPRPPAPERASRGRPDPRPGRHQPPTRCCCGSGWSTGDPHRAAARRRTCAGRRPPARRARRLSRRDGDRATSGAATAPSSASSAPRRARRAADAEAKAAAWARLLADDAVSNREFEATAAGLWDPEQAALVRHVRRRATSQKAPGGGRGAARPSPRSVLGKPFPAFRSPTSSRSSSCSRRRADVLRRAGRTPRRPTVPAAAHWRGLARRPGLAGRQACPSNIEVTEPSSKTSRMARATQRRDRQAGQLVELRGRRGAAACW